eukprot:8956384-Pyramimonas_sp.AAC.1
MELHPRLVAGFVCARGFDNAGPPPPSHLPRCIPFASTLQYRTAWLFTLACIALCIIKAHTVAEKSEG